MTTIKELKQNFTALTGLDATSDNVLLFLEENNHDSLVEIGDKRLNGRNKEFWTIAEEVATKASEEVEQPRVDAKEYQEVQDDLNQATEEYNEVFNTPIVKDTNQVIHTSYPTRKVNLSIGLPAMVKKHDIKSKKKVNKTWKTVRELYNKFA